MPFLQLTVDIGASDPAPLEDALLDVGAVSITLQDAADNPVLEPAPGTTPLWPSVQLSALFDAAVDPHLLREVLRTRLSTPLPPLHFEQLADRAWEREWLKDFRPMQFGRRLWICPGGQRPPADQLATTDDACIIELDPGLAFGTGTHPTTALCLEWLDGADLRGKTVIDYGCGSGVLAIAALKLGAKSAIAVDIDPQAITATLDNASRNLVAERLRVGLAADTALQPADVVLANILAEPLEALAASLTAWVVPGGHIVLSGLLTAQADRVAARYAPAFRLEPTTVRGDWARVDGMRQSAAV